MSEAIKIQSEGRRHYILGNTYAIKDQLRSAGCKWDADRKAWWTGKLDVAVGFAGTADAAPDSRPDGDRLTDDSRICGKATYKGRGYILVWEGETRRGRACKLGFADGSKVFWADASEVQITKRYDVHEYRGRSEYMTFGRLNALRERFVEDRKSGIDTSYRAYQEACEAAEDMDNFYEARNLEQMGYRAWAARERSGARSE